MPVTAMTEDEQTTAINLLEPDLGAVFEENRVRRDVQAALATMDVVDCKTFARIEETSTALRVWLHDDVGLDRHGADKIAVAKVVAAWEAAQTRTRALQTQEAEERSAGLPATITGRSIHCSAPCMGRKSSRKPHRGPVSQFSRVTSKVLLGVEVRPSRRRRIFGGGSG